MKNKENVANLIAQLKAEIETPYELAAVERLERELVEGAPKVEIIDEKRQKFNGITFYKRSSGHYHCGMGLHQAVWLYYFGLISEGYEIHHKNENKDDNNIENLQSLSKGDHSKIHNKLKLENRKKIKVVCNECGKEFEAYDCGKNRFCSDYCQSKYRHKKDKITKKCAVCGKEFVTAAYTNVKYCSPQCVGKARRKRKTIQCSYCGKNFTVHQNSTQIYCSKECQHNGRKHILETRNCIICGQEFEVMPSATTQTCSRSCATKLSAQRQGKNLLTRKRKRAKEKRVCEICGKVFITRVDGKASTCSQSCASKLAIKRKKVKLCRQQQE